ncbi:MAG: hypothetical protein ACRC4N_16750 [Gammaproteobacteria bacterium]
MCNDPKMAPVKRHNYEADFKLDLVQSWFSPTGSVQLVQSWNQSWFSPGISPGSVRMRRKSLASRSMFLTGRALL